MPGLVGAALHFADQRAPFLARAPIVLPIGARVLAPMVEELHVLAFKRLDLSLDEGVEFRQLVGNVLGQFEVHGGSPSIVILFDCIQNRKVAYDFGQHEIAISSATRSAHRGGCC